MAIVASIWWTLGKGQTADRLTQTYRRNGGQGRWQRNSIDYDFPGRKTGMSDADLGNWSFAYNDLNTLTRQTEARDKTIRLNLNGQGRTRGGAQRKDVNSAASVAIGSGGRVGVWGGPIGVTVSSRSGNDWRSQYYGGEGNFSWRGLGCEGQSKRPRLTYLLPSSGRRVTTTLSDEGSSLAT